MDSILSKINTENIDTELNHYLNIINKDIAIIIIWPKHYNFINELNNEIISNQFNIEYSNNLDINYTYLTNLLRYIHYGKKWWVDNLTNEVNKRFDNSNTLQYLIISGTDLHKKIKNFKKTIREKYKIDKSYFHISDPDCFDHLGIQCNCNVNNHVFYNETRKHINMLKHTNTIKFLKSASYNSCFRFHQFMKDYINTFNIDNNLIKDNFCIDNGGILAIHGIRDTHDLDFLYCDKNSDKIENIDLKTPNVGCENINHQLEYNRLGHSIHDIIHNPKNYFYYLDFKVMDISILQRFKFNRTHTIGTGHKAIRQKDINDYKLICDFLSKR